MVSIVLMAVAIIIIIAGLGLARAGRKYAKSEKATPDDVPFGVIGTIMAIVGTVGLLLTLALSTIYTQDPGQAKVLRSWTGEVVGQSTTEGLKFKAPWVDVIDYDIRNQQVIFALTTDKNDGHEAPNGPQITVQDREGVTANIDITVRYSVDPESVTEIYKRYNTQENFVSRFIENDIRAAVRTIPSKYGTLELLNNRAQAELDIHDYLVERWEKQGVRVETVSLQEIRYSDEVKSRFDAAQAARIEIEKAQAELQATEVSAKQKIVQAEAEAEANAILNSSLTEAILKQRYLDTLRELAKGGNVVVVPEGFNGFVNVK